MPLVDSQGNVYSQKAGASMKIKGGGKPAITGGTIRTGSGTVNIGVEQPEEKIIRQQTIQKNALDIKNAAKNAKSQAEKDAENRQMKMKELGKTIDSFAYQMAQIPSERGLPGRITGLGGEISGRLQIDPKIAAYQSFAKGLRPQLARGLGDVGNLSEVEQKAAENLLPSISDNTETRILKFKNFLDYLSIRGIAVEDMDLPHIKDYIQKNTGQPYSPPKIGGAKETENLDPLGVM